MTIKHENIDIYFHMRNHYKKLKSVKGIVNSFNFKGSSKRSIRPSTNGTCVKKRPHTRAKKSESPHTTGVPIYIHLPIHGESVKKHDCLNLHEKEPDAQKSPRSLSADGRKSRRRDKPRPTTRRHPLDMPDPSKSPVRSHSLGARLKQKKHKSRSKKGHSHSSVGSNDETELDQPFIGNVSEGDAPRLLIIDKDIFEHYTGAEDGEYEKLKEEFDPYEAEQGADDYPLPKIDDHLSRAGDSLSKADDYAYLQFLLRITEDIIRNDLYTNKDMRRVCSSHFEANKGFLDEEKMKVQIERLCKELGISLDEESPPPSREEMKRRRQEIKSTLVCKQGPIYRPKDDKEYEDCACGQIQCLPFQCSLCFGESEAALSDLIHPLEDDGVSQASRSLSRIKDICECLGYLSEHTEPDDSGSEVTPVEEKDVQPRTDIMTNKCCGFNLEDEAGDPSIPAEFSEPHQGAQSRKLPDCCTVSPDFFPKVPSASPRETKLLDSCAITPDFCPKKTESSSSPHHRKTTKLLDSCAITPDFCPKKTESSSSPHHRKTTKLLDSCAIEPDFCSPLLNKLFESCNIMPDFCAEIHEEVPHLCDVATSCCKCSPEKPECKLGVSEVMKEPSEVSEEPSKVSDGTEKPKDMYDDGKRLLSIDYDLTPEKEEIKLPPGFTPVEDLYLKELVNLPDFNIKDLLLDDDCQIPDKMDSYRRYPSWYLKTVATQTTPSFHKLCGFSYESIDNMTSTSESTSTRGTTSTGSISSPTEVISQPGMEDKALTPINESDEEDSGESGEAPYKIEESRSIDKSTSTESDEEDGIDEVHSTHRCHSISDSDSEQDEEKVGTKSLDSQFMPSEHLSIASDFDDSTDEEIDEYIVELNKKPVLSVTRSIQDRIASVTEKLEKFRQVNEVRTVSAAAALEENIKKTLSTTEDQYITEPIDEIKSSQMFEFIPPTINPSETDTGCCSSLLRKLQKKDKQGNKTQPADDKALKKDRHVIVADGEQMPDTDSKRNIRFSQMIVKQQHQSTEPSIATENMMDDY